MLKTKFAAAFTNIYETAIIPPPKRAKTSVIKAKLRVDIFINSF